MANPRIDELRRRLDKEPQSRLFAQLAEELRKEGDLGGAIRVAREGLDKHPSYVSARMTLGRALQDSGEIAGARKEFETVLASAPDNILAGRLLAQCLEGLGSLDAALARYRATLALSPGDPQLMTRVATLEQRMKGVPGLPPAGGGAAPLAKSVTDAADRRGNEAPAGGPSRNLSAVSREGGPATEGVQAGVAVATPGWAAAAGVGPGTPESTAGAPDLWTGEEFGPFGIDPQSGPAPHAAAVAEPELIPEPLDEEPMPLAAVDSAEFELEGALEAPGLTWQAPAVPESSELASPTLGELYFNQGHAGKAIEVYRRVVEQDPGNERARARLMELEAFERQMRLEAAPDAARTSTGAPTDPGMMRRQALERAIARLEGFRSAVKRARP